MTIREKPTRQLEVQCFGSFNSEKTRLKEKRKQHREALKVKAKIRRFTNRPSATVGTKVTTCSNLKPENIRLSQNNGEEYKANIDHFSATAGFKMTRRPEKEVHFAAATVEA